MKCPNCGGDMWDNRQKKKNPKAPDYKCKDKNCDGVIWPGESVETHFAHENPSGGPVKAPQSPPARQNHQRPAMSKDDYWRRKEERDVEVQKLIVRQHSQSMALEVLKLKQALNQLVVEDLTPSKLKQLADYFDSDVNDAACPKN